MNLTLYNISSDRKRMLKVLGSPVKEYNNVHLKEDTSIINPIFLLSNVGTDTGGLPKQFNYVECDYFHRYYFVNNVVYAKGGIIEIHCHVDVLFTYRDNILGHNAYIDRCEKQFYNAKQQQDSKNGIFFDTEYPIRTDSYVWTDSSLEFGSVANSKSYYLTVNGGVLS